MSLDDAMPNGDEGAPLLHGRDIDIARELHKSFLTYAMSVIIARALPDARDGLKPVHRRILYAMKIGKYTSDKPYKKSARIVGDVMGQLHPHGDSSIYDAMVRMAQDFKMRRPLIDGQGNFGSIDDDPAAAMRYTEARLDEAGEELLKDIESDTVDFCPNYDESMREPTVLPARTPNLLINGSSGIAVGMATEIPPHNPLEAIDACIALVRNPFITLDEIMEIMPGPDFPTGATLYGRALLRSAYETGRGAVPLRAKAEIETVRVGRSKEERKVIAFTEIPYAQNKAKLAELLGELADKEEKEGGIPGIADVRDESGREGIRIAVDLKKDADPEAVLAHIYKKTPLQKNVPFNMVALDFSSGEARPETMGLMDLLRIFVEHRRTVIKRRSAYELVRNRSKLHAQVALLAALDEIDAVIALIRGSSDNAEARAGLMAMRFRIHGLLADVVSLDPDAVVEEPTEEGGERVLRLDEEQARIILDLRLQRLSGMERDELAGEARDFAGRISDLLSILNNPARRDEVLVAELEEARDNVPKALRPRRTVIEAAPLEIRGDSLEMIPREDVLVTLTMNGYVKRVPLAAFNTQKRGGTGRTGTRPDSEDAVSLALRVTTHDSLLVVTSSGMAYSLRVHMIPTSDPGGRGKPIVGMIEALSGGKERITAVLPMPANAAAFGEEESLVFVTDQGTVRRNPLAAFARINSAGKIAMRLHGEGEDGEAESLGELIAVLRASERDDVILFTQKGKFCRFPVTDVRESKGRDSMGVRGIDIRGAGDRVVGAAVLAAGEKDADLREAFLKARRAGQEIASDPRLAPLAASESILLSVTENGFGKRSSSHEYRATNRGTKGYTAADLTVKTGSLAACVQVGLDDEVMLTTRKGMSIRMKTTDIVLQGRSTCGVKLMRLDPDDAVKAAIRLAAPQEETPTE